MNIECRIVIFFLCLVLPPGYVARAQVDEKVLRNLQDRPTITVSTSQRSYDVTAAIDVHVRVVNLTDKNMFLKEVRLDFPGEVRAARGEDVSDKDTIYTATSDDQLVPGIERIQSFKIGYKQIKWYAPPFNRPLLMFLPAEYDLITVVKIMVPPENASRPINPDYSSCKHKMSKRARHVESDQRVTGYPQKTAETRPG